VEKKFMKLDLGLKNKRISDTNDGTELYHCMVGPLSEGTQ
jgi:hypothetical protein